MFWPDFKTTHRNRPVVPKKFFKKVNSEKYQINSNLLFYDEILKQIWFHYIIHFKINRLIDYVKDGSV